MEWRIYHEFTLCTTGGGTLIGSWAVIPWSTFLMGNLIFPRTVVACKCIVFHKQSYYIVCEQTIPLNR